MEIQDYNTTRTKHGASSGGGYPRAELEDMMQRWLAANQRAEASGNWTQELPSFYTEDAVYQWNMGSNHEFVAHGRDDIRDIALGWFMKGFENWTYPYHDIMIDDQRGSVICFYKHQLSVTCAVRQDGSPYQVDGLHGTWFEYAGNYQWRWQRDFFDVGNVQALVFELAGRNLLRQDCKTKMRDHAWGTPMPGVVLLRPEPSVLTKVWNFLAMMRVILLGG